MGINIRLWLPASHIGNKVVKGKVLKSTVWFRWKGIVSTRIMIIMKKKDEGD